MNTLNLYFYLLKTSNIAGQLMLAMLFVFCVNINVFAENVHVHWLPQVLEKADELDVKDPFLAYEYLNEVKQTRFAELNAFDQATILNKLANYKVFLGDYEFANELNKQAQALHPEITSETGINIALIEGSLLDIYGKSAEAKQVYHRAIEQAKKEENTQLLADGYAALATSYAYTYQDVEAIQYYQKAYSLVNQLNDELQVAYLKSNLATTYMNLYDYDKAIALLNEAIVYFTEHKLPYDEMRSQITLSRSLMALKQYDKAIICFEKILELSQYLGEKRFVYFAHFGLAEINFKQKEYEAAKTEFKLADDYFSFIQDPFSQMMHFLLSASIANQEKDTVTAQNAIQKVESFVAKLDQKENIYLFIRLSDQKAKLLATLGDYEGAYNEKVASEELLTEYHSQEREDARSKYKVMFDTEQTELQNKLLQQSSLIDQLALEKAKQTEQMQKLVNSLFAAILILLSVFVYRQVKVSKRLNRLANTDSLTQLANRRYTFHFAKIVFKEAQIEQKPLSIIIFDIDHFKRINDNYGHPFGDEVLMAVADKAQAGLREPDLLGRIGGEEFMVVLKNTPINQAVEIAERMRELIAQLSFAAAQQQVKVTASFGVAQFNVDVDDFGSLFQHADEALYRAKNAGRNQVVCNKD